MPFRFIQVFLVVAGLLIAVTATFFGVALLWVAPGLALLGVAFVAMGIYGVTVLVRAIRLQRPGPVAKRVYLSVFQGMRAREWGLSVEEVRAEAATSRDGGVMLLFAYSVAIDTGEVEAAARILDQAMAPGSNLGGWARSEFLLQRVMLTALVGNDPSQARRHLEAAMSRRVLKRAYARLAESTVLLSEGRVEQARVVLGEWTRMAEGSRRRGYTEIGNHWALDLMRTRLGDLQASPSPGP